MDKTYLTSLRQTSVFDRLTKEARLKHKEMLHSKLGLIEAFNTGTIIATQTLGTTSASLFPRARPTYIFRDCEITENSPFVRVNLKDYQPRLHIVESN